MAKVPVQFTLNGSDKAEFIESGTTLLNALRDKLGDTSPKGGCHQGTCGACSVMIDGELKLSCLTLAEMCEGATIETTAVYAGSSPGQRIRTEQRPRHGRADLVGPVRNLGFEADGGTERDLRLRLQVQPPAELA